MRLYPTPKGPDMPHAEGPVPRPVGRTSPPAGPNILAVMIGPPIGVAFGNENCLISAREPGHGQDGHDGHAGAAGPERQ